MPTRGYPPEFRRRALDLLVSGRRVVDVYVNGMEPRERIGTHT